MLKNKPKKTPSDQILQSTAKSPLTWETDQYGLSQLLSMMYACVVMFARTQQDPFSVLHSNLRSYSQISSELRTFFVFIYMQGKKAVPKNCNGHVHGQNLNLHLLLRVVSTV